MCKHVHLLQALATNPAVLDAPPEGSEDLQRPPPCTKQHTPVSIAARVQTLTNAGSIERAAAALEPQTMAEPSEAIKARLETLHPHETPPHVPQVDTPPAQCDEEL